MTQVIDMRSPEEPQGSRSFPVIPLVKVSKVRLHLDARKALLVEDILSHLLKASFIASLDPMLSAKFH